MKESFKSDTDFTFTYEIGWNIKSMHEVCYAGDSFQFPKPTCGLECNSKQCLLEPLKDQNKKRVLQALAG